MTISFFSLITPTTVAQIYARGLELAAGFGLPVTSWRTGDPTRSLYYLAAEILGTQDGVVAEFIKAAALSTAEGDWLKALAYEVYGVEVDDATYATPTVTLTNSGGGVYDLEAGDLRVKATSTGKTYHSTSAGLLSSGATVTFDLEADEAGSDSTVGVDEIDELVTTLLGVVIDSNTAGVGVDVPSDEFIREQCRSTLGPLSPNGPADAFSHVVRSSSFTGETEITKANPVGDAGTGVVTIYVAGASGPVSAGAVTAAQAAVELWSTPLTVTPTVVNSAAVEVAVTADISGEDIPADFETTIDTALGEYFAALPVGADVSASAIVAAMHAAVPEIRTIALSAPAADVAISAGQVGTLGATTIAEV